MKYSVLWCVALLLVLIMSWSIRCSWKEQINPAGSSSSSTCSSAIQPTFLNSDPRTTSGDKSPFLSVSPRCSAKTVSRERTGRGSRAVVQQGLVHQKLLCAHWRDFTSTTTRFILEHIHVPISPRARTLEIWQRARAGTHLFPPDLALVCVSIWSGSGVCSANQEMLLPL